MVFVISIWRAFVVHVNYFHDEGNEGIHKDVTARVVVAPDLKQIQQLLSDHGLMVERFEKFKELRRDFRRHLSNYPFIQFRK